MDPEFNEEQTININLMEREVKVCKLNLVVKDKDITIDEEVGYICIDLVSILEDHSQFINNYFPIYSSANNDKNNIINGYLYIQIEYVPKN